MSLYGGAISSVIPPHYLDASDLRQVPDNQEVYVGDGAPQAEGSVSAEESLVFDLLEQITHVDDLGEAAECHLNEITALNGADQYHILLEPRPLNNVSGLPTSLLVGVEPALKWGKVAPNKHETPLLVIVLALVRIARANTDFIVSYNLPIVDTTLLHELHVTIEKNEPMGPKMRPIVEAAMAKCQTAAEAVTINDWSLFA